jgi:hypothetical protein
MAQTGYVWEGLQTTTDYKGKTSHGADTVLLSDKLNTPFTRFEDSTVPPTQPAPKDCGLSISVADVSKTFKRVNTRKAAGRGQTNWLECLRIYSISPYPSLVSTHDSRWPPLFLDPRKQRSLNEMTTLTSVTMKCFERLVNDHLISTLHDTLDPLQFDTIDPQTMQSPSHCSIPFGQQEYLRKNAVH